MKAARVKAEVPPRAMVKAAKPPAAGTPVWWRSGRDDRFAPWTQAQVWATVTFGQRYGLALSDADIAKEVTNFLLIPIDLQPSSSFGLRQMAIRGHR